MDLEKGRYLKIRGFRDVDMAIGSGVQRFVDARGQPF